MKIKPSYVVCGTESADPTSAPVFYALDTSSGYPVASPFQKSTTEDLTKAVEWLDECGPGQYANMCNAQVMMIDYVPVDISRITDAAARVSGLLKGMSDEEKAAMKKMLS